MFNFSLIVTAIFYSMYWFSGKSHRIISFFGGSGSSQAEWNIKRILGFVFMGLIPLILILSFDIASIEEVGVNNNWHPNTWLWLLIFGSITLILNVFASKSESNLAQYPQIRNEHWTISTFIYEFGGWLIYLVGYEFLFRGILLFGTIPLIGETPAIALNVAIYSLAHMVKGWQETFGAIILGVILCYFTILSGSIWFALILHVIQAWINSILSFRNQPQMKYGS